MYLTLKLTGLKQLCLIEIFFLQMVSALLHTLHNYSLQCISPFTADFLGSTSIKIDELLKDGEGPWTKRQLLEHVHTGEIEFQLQYEAITFV